MPTIPSQRQPGEVVKRLTVFASVFAGVLAAQILSAHILAVIARVWFDAVISDSKILRVWNCPAYAINTRLTGATIRRKYAGTPVYFFVVGASSHTKQEEDKNG